MRSRAVAGLVLAALTVGAVTGCGPSHGKSPGSGGQGGAPGSASGAATQCGTAHTAAGVPVDIEVHNGRTPCRTAMIVERAYSRAVASGKVAGNGGGAPVTINGWICQGFNTPQVLATGHASACHKNGTEILAVLPTPSASPAS